MLIYDEHDWECDGCFETVRGHAHQCAADGCRRQLCADSAHECSDCEEKFCRRHLPGAVCVGCAETRRLAALARATFHLPCPVHDEEAA